MYYSMYHYYLITCFLVFYIISNNLRIKKIGGGVSKKFLEKKGMGGCFCLISCFVRVNKAK